MNAKMKKRLIAVTGVVVIVVVAVLAFVGGSTAATSVTVAEAAEADAGQKVQVSGNVVPDSFETSGEGLAFSLYDPADEQGPKIAVRYDGAASATFGNDITAICTGRIGDDGVLECSELITKCPSKYESAQEALTVGRLLGYGADIEGAVVKVTGAIGSGTLVAPGHGERFALVDADAGAGGASRVSVAYDGALPEGVDEGAEVVLTGTLSSSGSFEASDVALKG